MACVAPHTWVHLCTNSASISWPTRWCVSACLALARPAWQAVCLGDQAVSCVLLQNDAMSAATKLHQGMDALMKENEALTLKAALATTFKVTQAGGWPGCHSGTKRCRCCVAGTLPACSCVWTSGAACTVTGQNTLYGLHAAVLKHSAKLTGSLPGSILTCCRSAMMCWRRHLRTHRPRRLITGSR